jgi:proline dehydrogenase
VIRSLLLAASRRLWVRDAMVRLPVTRDVVGRFIAGETIAEAMPVIRSLVDAGLSVTVDHLGEDTTLPEQADATAAAYVELLREIEIAGLAASVEASMKLSALGQFLPVDGEATALRNARTICAEAARIGTTVTVDMEDHTTTDSTLRLVEELRRDYPWVGAVLQSSLRRTEADCRRFAHPGSRIRLCKGAYASPEAVAYPARHEVDLSYVRCLRTLLDGCAKPMLATHDPRLIAIGESLLAGRDRSSYEFQMLYGIRPLEQQRLAAEGHTVRVYVPYGSDWYGYFVRRLAERPANVAFFLRSLVGRR